MKITEQDILDLGWEGKNNLWRLGYFLLSGQLEYNVLEIRVDEGCKHMDEYFFDWVTLFNGRIETKEELAWVMKAVGVPQNN